MLKVAKRFGKHCSCHLQGKYVEWVFSESKGAEEAGLLLSEFV
jgi:hypothetical protein